MALDKRVVFRHARASTRSRHERASAMSALRRARWSRGATLSPRVRSSSAGWRCLLCGRWSRASSALTTGSARSWRGGCDGSPKPTRLTTSTPPPTRASASIAMSRRGAAKVFGGWLAGTLGEPGVIIDFPASEGRRYHSLGDPRLGDFSGPIPSFKVGPKLV
jgi:hypothetical protein